MDADFRSGFDVIYLTSCALHGIIPELIKKWRLFVNQIIKNSRNGKAFQKKMKYHIYPQGYHKELKYISKQK